MVLLGRTKNAACYSYALARTIDGILLVISGREKIEFRGRFDLCFRNDYGRYPEKRAKSARTNIENAQSIAKD